MDGKPQRYQVNHDCDRSQLAVVLTVREWQLILPTLIQIGRFATGLIAIITLLAILEGCGRQPVPTTKVKPQKTTINVAAASDLKFAFDEIIDEFQRKFPEITIEVTYGSSGNFYAQLENKAPFDIFLSADINLPRKLIELGLAEKDTEFLYAVGRVGIWVRNDSPLDFEKLGQAGLMDASVHSLAIANPKHAPYGRAAEAALHHFGLYEQVKDRLVFGENVAQATQFVETGSADVGIIAHSLALAPRLKEKGRFWLIPAEAHPKLEQGGIILNWAKDHQACQQLRSFLVSESGQEILRRFGFERSND